MNSQSPSGRSKSESKRQQILDAASRLFINNVYNEVSMNLVAKEAGVSKQTVYSHFGCKEDLFAAAIEAKCVEFNLGDALTDLERPIEQALLAFANDFVELLKSDDVLKLLRVFMSNGPDANHIAEIAWQVSSKRTIDELSRYLDKQQQQGKLHLDDINIKARQFMALIDGLWNTKQLMGIATEEDMQMIPAYTQSAVQLFLAGCK